MLPKAKELRRQWFEWPEAVFGRFNFHRDAQIDAAVDQLLSGEPPDVLVLSGEEGIGRSYFCEAVRHRARSAGHPIGVWHLDLDGFEPEIEKPLERYLAHLLEQQEADAAQRRSQTVGALRSVTKALSKTDLVGQATEWAASIVSLLWQFEDPVERFAALLSQRSPGRQAASRSEPELLRQLLTDLTRERRLLIHVDAPELTDPLRRWLIREAERRPERLLLVMSCSPPERSEDVAPYARNPPSRIDLELLNLEELRQILDRRFSPNDFTAEFHQALMRSSRGRPAALAALMADLMDSEHGSPVAEDEDGRWSLPPAGMSSKRVIKLFSVDLLEDLDARLVEEGAVGEAVRKLFVKAALCGKYFPAAPLLEHLEIDADTAEAALDFIDDYLVAEAGWLEDLEYRHPAFSGFNLYAFTHPVLPGVILDQLSDVEREMQAITLLRFLEQKIAPNKRGVAKIFLAIATHLDPVHRDFYERQLSWWSGQEGSEELAAHVRKEIEQHKVDSALVWRIATTSTSWPPYRRLALLDAYGNAKNAEGVAYLPFERLADFHLLRAQLLLDLGRYKEALEQALRALALVENDRLQRARILDACGEARLHGGEYSDAQKDLEEAHALFKSELGSHHPATLAVMASLAATLRVQGDLPAAAELEHQVLEASKRIRGEEHPDTLRAMGNLAATLGQQRDLPAAAELKHKVLEAMKRILGDEHPHTLTAMANLAATLSAQGDLPAAAELEHQVLKASKRILGDEHPDTLSAMRNLAAMLRVQGDLAGATELEQKFKNARS